MKMNVLEIAMIVPIPRLGCVACKYHMAEKSPVVQPTKHRIVLTEALCHVDFDDQNPKDSIEPSLDSPWQLFFLSLTLFWHTVRSCNGMVPRMTVGTRLARHCENCLVNIEYLEDVAVF